MASVVVVGDETAPMGFLFCPVVGVSVGGVPGQGLWGARVGQAVGLYELRARCLYFAAHPTCPGVL